jgi:hypothetical protein
VELLHSDCPIAPGDVLEQGRYVLGIGLGVDQPDQFRELLLAESVALPVEALDQLGDRDVIIDQSLAQHFEHLPGIPGLVVRLGGRHSAQLVNELVAVY